MTVFINSHSIRENGNGLYLIDLIEKLNFKSVKIISLSCAKLKKKYSIFTLKHKKKSKNILGKLSEIFFLNYLVLKNLKEIKNETIVFTSDPPMSGLVLIIISKIFRLNLIFWCQDIFPNTLIVSNILKKNNIFFLFLKFINKFIYNNVNKIVTISRSMKRTLIEEYKVSSERIILIENWSLSYLKKERGKKDNKINIFYNGNISLVHDEEFAINFIKQIKNKDLNFKILTNSRKIKKNYDKKLFKKKFLSQKIFQKYLMKSDFQMIFSKPDALKYIYPSKMYNILHFKKPIIYFNKSDKDEISWFLKKHQIGISINKKNIKKFVNLFSNTKKVKMLIKFYQKNYKKLDFLDHKKNISITKWKDLMQCVG